MAHFGHLRIFSDSISASLSLVDALLAGVDVDDGNDDDDDDDDDADDADDADDDDDDDAVTVGDVVEADTDAFAFSSSFSAASILHTAHS